MTYYYYFHSFIKNQEYSSVHVLIRAENVHVIEKNIRQFFFALKGSKTGGAADNWEQKFVPLKVSSVLLTLDSKMLLCLVLASLVDSGNYFLPFLLFFSLQKVDSFFIF